MLLGLAGALGQDVRHRLLDQAAAARCGCRAGGRPSRRSCGSPRRADGGTACAVGDRDVLGQRPLAGPDGAGHDPGHPGITLQTGDVGRAVLADPDLGDETGHGREGDPRLSQRGEDLLDVAEEERVGTDHQHALPLEGEPVRVEQIGGPVQGHGRLAGARAALHDQHPSEWGPDDLVLLALDRGDDVGHPAGPGTVQRGPGGRPGRRWAGRRR